MIHNVRVTISTQHENVLETCKKRIPAWLYRLLFGKATVICCLRPGQSVRDVEICQCAEDGDKQHDR